MIETILLILSGLILLLLIVLLFKRPALRLPQLDAFERNQEKLERMVREESGRSREEANSNAKELRGELNRSLTALGEALAGRVIEIAKLQKDQLDSFSRHLGTFTQTNEQKLEKVRETLDAHLRALQQQSGERAQQDRAEMARSFKAFSEDLKGRVVELTAQQKTQLDELSKALGGLTQTLEKKVDEMRATVEQKLAAMQEDNGKKLEEMRKTVDEKLHATLEQRLGESFKHVSERLEMVHKGLGEMQNLAVGVGDLKRVLSNVSTRGIYGQIILEKLLAEILTAEQYAVNVATRKGSNERVEFAIKLPAKDGAGGVIYLPIDSKWPQQDFESLLLAQEQGNAELVREAGKQLEARIRQEAKDIKEKYLDPPNTTDFGILFLPVESLYAEVLRRPGLGEALRREYNVVLTGPTTLAALLSSLQMGFRTLAIEKRSSEVWQILGAVKTEFRKFGEILDKTQKKLQEASNTIDDAAKESRKIERQLKNVQELPAPAVENLLEPGASPEKPVAAVVTDSTPL